MGLVEKEGAFLTVCLKDIVKSEDIAKSENIAGSEDIARLEVIAGSEDIAGSGDTVRPGDKDKMNIRKLVLTLYSCPGRSGRAGGEICGSPDAGGCQ